MVAKFFEMPETESRSESQSDYSKSLVEQSLRLDQVHLGGRFEEHLDGLVVAAACLYIVLCSR